MKKLLVIFIVLFTTSALAATDVSFRWDPNQEPDLAGYRLYRSATSGDYTLGAFIKEIPCGPNDAACSETVDQGVPDGTYFWVVTAFDTEGLESVWSNEQTSILDSTPPGAPQNLSIWQKIIAWFRELFKTNLRIV